MQKALEGFRRWDTYINNRINPVSSVAPALTKHWLFLPKTNSKCIYISLKVRNKILSDIKVSVEEIYIETPEYNSLMWNIVQSLGHLT